MPKPILRSDVLDMKDLKPGMILKGTVRNVIDFGVFVDIGVHQDGLVHISQMCDRFIKHPRGDRAPGIPVPLRYHEASARRFQVPVPVFCNPGFFWRSLLHCGW